MKSTRYLYLGAQLFGWILYALFVGLATYVDDAKKITPQLFLHIISFIFFAFLFTHIMRLLFFKWNWLEMKLTPLLPRILLSSLICAIGISISTEIIAFSIDIEDEKSISILKLLLEILANSVLILFWNALYFTYHFFSQSRKQEINNLSLEASRNEIELKNLRTQLKPHFLLTHW